jgi:hypothetical protein
MLETRNIFLDTSTIIANQYDYANPSLSRLEELVAKGEARLVTTTVTIAEVEANIRESVAGVQLAVDRLLDRHPIMRNVPALAFDREKALSALIEQFRGFLTRTETVIIEPHGTSIKEVLEWFFARQPPFGEGKKKSEFPDAFAVSTLERWCAERNERLYVVATDPDMATYCRLSKHLISLQRPGEFIEKVLGQNAALRVVEESASEHLDAIAEAIKDQFTQLGFYLDDEEGDVNFVDVIQVDLDEVSLLEVKGNSAVLDANPTIKFVADVSYPDMETAVWDSEERVAHPLRTIRKTVTRCAEPAVTVEIRANSEGRFDSVVKVTFAGGDIPVSANEYGHYR